MANSKYYQAQVSLLLSVLPEIAKENCFALHGGTAINLFIRNMPRLSLDIDLTYVPIENRETSLNNIHDALLRVKQNIEKIIPNVQITHKNETGKLLVSFENSTIKIEVNLVNRGLIAEPTKLALCQKGVDTFNAFTLMPIVPFSQLYGGKICAALDRQHPRDLFDVKILLENEGFSEEIKKGFIFCLLASDRPLHEMLNPNLL